MSYNITLTNGNSLVTVADGTTDTSSTSLTLVGKNYAGYGRFLNENYVQLLENFSNPTGPNNPLQGQLWWDSSHKVIQVWNGTAWTNIARATSSVTAPINAGTGDLWWDSANGQLKIFNSTTWIVIGPAYTSSQGQTGSIADIVTDTGSTSHIVVKFYVNNEVAAILSHDTTFTISTIPGFTSIKPGLTLASALLSSSDIRYYGTADVAKNLLTTANGSVTADNFLRTDIAGTLTNNLSIKGASVQIGPANDLAITRGGSGVAINETQSNMSLTFGVTVGAIQTTVLTLDGTTGSVIVPATTINSNPNSAATKLYVDNSVTYTAVGARSTNTITTSTTSGTVIASISATASRSAEFLIQAVDATGAKYHVCKLQAIHNGVSASWVEYGSIDIGGQAATYSVNLVSGTLQLVATPTTANSTVFKVTAYAVNI